MIMFHDNPYRRAEHAIHKHFALYGTNKPEEARALIAKALRAARTYRDKGQAQWLKRYLVFCGMHPLKEKGKA